jgi:hypothetical protein
VDRAYLQWNLPNWITVVLMASIGVVLLQFAASGLRQYQAK